MREPAFPSRPIVIAGPTAVGKTGLALEVAERWNAEIVSCDSVAVYRGCDVGAAKPSAAERARVPHHLLDVAAPDERFSAADYVEHADRAIAEISARGRPVIVVGGTGLYLRALVDGLFPSPPPDPVFRAALREEAERLGWPALHARLQALDPAAAARIAPTDPVRIERALEVHAQTGEPISALQARYRAEARPRYRTLTLLVDPGQEELDRRIALRIERMLAQGLVEETRRLVARHGRDAKPLAAVGYKEVLAFIDGHLGEAELGPAIQRATRHFARRQRTWFAKYEAHREHVHPVAAPGDVPWDAIGAFLAAPPPSAT
ncbi:MAG TPA: tRNA (adenosine(37)-N6)-dimethylallyltransferase MiaA [Polyangia bacterium]|nr:tRNA (adenosine(37)-N6)-dimethylallyltransferase MiaA [Polyangia bacterium]